LKQSGGEERGRRAKRRCEKKAPENNHEAQTSKPQTSNLNPNSRNLRTRRIFKFVDNILPFAAFRVDHNKNNIKLCGVDTD
jgi:hypothetical protein